MMWLICYCRVLNDKGEDIELFSSIECKVSTRAQSLFSKIHHLALSLLCLKPNIMLAWIDCCGKQNPIFYRGAPVQMVLGC